MWSSKKTVEDILYICKYYRVKPREAMKEVFKDPLSCPIHDIHSIYKKRNPSGKKDWSGCNLPQREDAQKRLWDRPFPPNYNRQQEYWHKWKYDFYQYSLNLTRLIRVFIRLWVMGKLK